MWSEHTGQLSNARKTFINRESAPMTFAAVLRSWQEDAAFRSFSISLLAASPLGEFRWETPSITAASVVRPFEFVLLDSPGLVNEPDPEAFADYFENTPAEGGVISFPNLGRDAILVVPCPLGPSFAYGHLAAFLRRAQEQQKHSLWKVVGRVVEQALGPNPIWVSTAGAGVSWLHVRIDQRPKYYGYGPYRH